MRPSKLRRTLPVPSTRDQSKWMIRTKVAHQGHPRKSAWSIGPTPVVRNTRQSWPRALANRNSHSVQTPVLSADIHKSTSGEGTHLLPLAGYSAMEFPPAVLLFQGKPIFLVQIFRL